jgi:AcrR family transcriptional regulator
VSTTPQRARSEAAKRQRWNDLLVAARALAANGGVNSVTLAAVTESAGLHPSAVRRYFASKEELLLELAEQEWATWRTVLVTRLHGARGLPPEAIGAAIAETLAAQPLFCDLITHVALTLEDGVSHERVLQYKTAAFEDYDAIADSLAAASDTLSLAGAQDVLSGTLALAAYLWQVAHPGPVLARVYLEVPRWGHMVTHFEADLKRLITELVVGASSSAG